MSVTAHEISLEALDGLTGIEALCLFVAPEDRPLKGAAGYVDWRLCGALSRVLVDDFFTGAPEDSLLLPTSGRFPMGRIFVFGTGPAERLDASGLGALLEKAARTLTRAGVETVALELPGEARVDEGARAGAFKSQFLPAFKKNRVAVLGPRALGRLLTSD